MFLMKPVPVRKTEAQGVLVDFYTKGSDNLKQLRDKGYVHIKAAIPMAEVWKLIAMFDVKLKEGGFKGRFADPKNIKTPEDLPYGVWGLDNRWLAHSEAAMHARWLMRNVIAAEAGVDPETLVSSFDAVMATWPGYTNKPWFDLNDPRLPVKFDDKGKAAGPGHMDVCCDEKCTANSHQGFCPMTPAEAHDMSTILLVPRGEWTLQGMMDACRERFPKAFDPTILNPKNHAREGFFFSPFAVSFPLGTARCDNLTALAAQCQDEDDRACFNQCCLKCEKGMNCETPANNTLQALAIEDGWWRDTVYSHDVYPCEYTDSCKAGACTTGHTGVACRVCEAGYHYSSMDGRCIECPGSGKRPNLALVIGVLIFLVVMLGIFLYCYVRRPEMLFVFQVDWRTLFREGFSGLMGRATEEAKARAEAKIKGKLNDAALGAIDERELEMLEAMAKRAGGGPAALLDRFRYVDAAAPGLRVAVGVLVRMPLQGSFFVALCKMMRESVRFALGVEWERRLTFSIALSSALRSTPSIS